MEHFTLTIDNLLRSLRCPPGDLPDIIQEAWTRATVYLRQERSALPENFHAWLATVAKNAYFDEVRKSKAGGKHVFLRPVEKLVDNLSRPVGPDAQTAASTFISRKEYVMMIIREVCGAKAGVRLERWWRARTSGLGVSAGDAARMIGDNAKSLSNLWNKKKPLVADRLALEGIDERWLSELDGEDV